MVRWRKKPYIDRKLMELHRNIIIQDLQLKHEPVVIYGDAALTYLRENVPEYRNKTDKQILFNTGGYFDYENTPQKYIKTGVVCILNGKISSLAHELCHAKQYQENYLKLNRGKWSMRLYGWTYGVNRAELKANSYAIKYLWRSKLYKSAFLCFLKTLVTIFIKTPVMWPITTIIGLVMIVLYILWLNQF